MELLNVIVHKLNKEQRKSEEEITPPSIQLRDKEYDKDNDVVQTLIEKLSDSYKKGKTFGTFDSDIKNHPFQEWLGEMLDEAHERDFISLTKDVMGRLLLFIKDVNFATGGHLLFAHYKHSDSSWLIIVMLKDKEGFTFTDDLSIKNIQEVDIDKLHQLARVDLTKWTEKSEGYLSFIKKRAGDVSGYFIDALGCTNLIPSKQATNNVFTIVDMLLGEAKIETVKVLSFKEKLYEFLDERRPDTVKLAEIEALVDAELPIEFHGRFIEEANSDKYKISDEFEPHAQALIYYKRIKHKTAKWALDISRDAIGLPDSGAELIYDDENNTLTLTDVPDDLSAEIKKSFIKENE
jgi:nucleoid-associated protein YejK